MIKFIENGLMKYVFENCFEKGFRNYSLCNLRDMLSDPEGDNYKKLYQNRVMYNLVGGIGEKESKSEYEKRKRNALQEVRSRLHTVEHILEDSKTLDEYVHEPVSILIEYLWTLQKERMTCIESFDNLSTIQVIEVFKTETDPDIHDALMRLQTAATKLGILTDSS